MFDFEVKLMDY